MRAAASLGILVALACSDARADDQLGDDVALWSSRGAYLVNLLPSELGADSTLRRDQAVPRFRLGWSYQLPICWLGSPPALYSRCGVDDASMRHRLVLSLRLALGRQETPRSGEVVPATFDARLGYRYRFPHAGRLLAPYLGAGSTCEFWPDGPPRASISPELGVHIGKELSAFPPNVVLGWQADLFFAYEPRSRLMAFVGYSFL